jgi:hypothetical protein
MFEALGSIVSRMVDRHFSFGFVYLWMAAVTAHLLIQQVTHSPTTDWYLPCYQVSNGRVCSLGQLAEISQVK